MGGSLRKSGRREGGAFLLSLIPSFFSLALFFAPAPLSERMEHSTLVGSAAHNFVNRINEMSSLVYVFHAGQHKHEHKHLCTDRESPCAYASTVFIRLTALGAY